MTKIYMVIFGFALSLSIVAHATTRSEWPNSYRDKAGNTWSDALPGTFANCFSDLDYILAGVPVPPPSSANAKCRFTRGNYPKLQGDSEDGKTVIMSDATYACKSIGGELPTKQDFDQLGDEYKNMPNMNPGAGFWSASLNNEPLLSQGVGIDFEPLFGRTEESVSRAYKLSVRCIAHASTKN